MSLSYDKLGRRTGMTDGTGTLSWVWDSLGRMLSATDPTGIITYGYADSGASPTSVTYPGGKTVTRTYDDAGRQVSSTGWAGGTASFGYDPNSNLSILDTPATSAVEDTFGYDRADRMTAATLRDGTSEPTTLGFTRDPEGMVTASSGSGIAGAHDSFGYGPLDQLTSTAAGAYSYDAADNLIGMPGGRQQRFNAAGELCHSGTDLSPSAPCGSAPAAATWYDYDPRGNRTAERPAGGVPTLMSYDQADRMSSVTAPTAPDGSGQYHDLSSAGIYLTNNVAMGAYQTLSYQIAGTYGIPTTGVESVVLRLHVANPTAYGQLCVSPGSGCTGSTAAMYTNPGEEASNLAVSALSPTGGLTVQALIASAGSIVSVELVGWYGSAPVPGGLTYQPVTGARAFQADVAAGSTSTIAVAGWHGVPATEAAAVAVVVHSLSTSTTGYLIAYGGPSMPGSATLVYDHGLASTFTIVPLGADGTIKLATSAATNAAVDVVGYYTSVESAAGSIAHTLSPQYAAFTGGQFGTCDGGTCNRLAAGVPVKVQVTGTAGVPTTGVAAVAVIVEVHNPAAAGVLDAGGTPVLYDDAYTSSTAIVPVAADGTITITSTQATDIAVQVLGYYEPASKTYVYSYTGDGLRHTKTAPDGTLTRFTWDRSAGLPLLLAESIDAPGTSTDRTVRYVHGPGGTVTSDIITHTSTGTHTLRWYHHDQLGSTRSLTDTAGAVLATYSYDPFGKATTTSGSATTPIGWAGQYQDAETGYSYLRARYYASTSAQFLTRDPLVHTTRSPYGYVNNNPLNSTDPTGLCPICVVVLGGALLGGAGDLGTQVAINLISGCDPFSTINYRQIGVSTVLGGALGGLARLQALRNAAEGAGGAAQVLKGPIADAIPRNLPQQMALGAARDGQGAVIMRNLGDANRLIANYGPGEWVKLQYVLRGTDSNVTVHYFRNLTTKMDVEFKFK